MPDTALINRHRKNQNDRIGIARLRSNGIRMQYRDDSERIACDDAVQKLSSKASLCGRDRVTAIPTGIALKAIQLGIRKSTVVRWPANRMTCGKYGDPLLLCMDDELASCAIIG
jgi:hypothetical protein